jgi:hypothetical protein
MNKNYDKIMLLKSLEKTLLERQIKILQGQNKDHCGKVIQGLDMAIEETENLVNSLQNEDGND